ncbi:MULTISPECIES: hypothetical protein [Pyrobaculum]|uniref:FUN14 family protein n=1 Tax=Pyrobaculum arsenaticum TaxID=121277 RepID=A0A7L4PBB6_9CREN|nr:hypothetical protein [Pyrobaculum arsenaticum]MCY0890814.1 hypothetical protein [Pyrobaculum arsenaticum]NYR15737.1 hypothetical protein [Pyrobaculum arsenaticum]
MLEQIAAVVGPFVVGLLVGIVAKRLLSAALFLIALFIVLAALGYMTPDQVSAFLQQMGYAAKEAVSYAMRIKELVPYSSAAFLLGLIIGLWKG